MIAARFSGLDETEVYNIDPTYATMHFKYLSWDGDGEEYTEGTYEIPTHRCTEGELGLTGDTSDSLLMPLKEEIAPDVKYYRQNYICADEQELEVYGNYNSAAAQFLTVKIDRCHDRPDCKSEAEIDEFFRGKYLVILYNSKIFDSNKREEDSVVSES